MAGLGHDITVLTGVPNYPGGRVFEEYAADPRRYGTYCRARIVRVPLVPRGQGKLRLLINYLSFAVSATAVGILRLSRSDFDAVFVFEPSPVTVGIPAVVLRALHGWPVAFWVLDQWPESLAAVGVVASQRTLALVGILVRVIYRRCDLILSPSKRLIPQIAKYSKPGQRISYFPNWAEAEYELDSSEAPPELAPYEGRFNVMFAGNIGEAQDFPTILGAAELLKEHGQICWLIVGEGRMMDWVRGEIERRDLQSSVFLLGRFPSSRMPAFFRQADALLVSLRPDPVFSMTAPGKIPSYLAAGRPVLAMLDGEGAAVIDEAGAGLTSPAGDAAKLADNVLALASRSVEERELLGRRGQAFAAREFDRAVLMARLESWLQQLARRRHGGPTQ